MRAIDAFGDVEETARRSQQRIVATRAMSTAKFYVLAFACLFAVVPGMNTQAATDVAQRQLLDAIEARDPVAARAALDAGAEPNRAGAFNRTPLHAAAAETAELVELLIERGAQLNPLDDDGRAPLHLANADTAKVLLSHRADFLILDKNGNSVLHTAAEASAELCALFIDAGMPVDARNNAGLSPLHFAAVAGNHEVVQYLRSRGADMNALRLAQDGETTERSLARTPRFVWLLVSPIGFLVFFYLLFQLDAYLRDWTSLANRFTAAGTPAGIDAHQDGAVGRIGTIHLRKMLRAAATEEGLYIAMPAWVVAGHPPLTIPWSQLRIESCKRGLAGLRLRLRVVDLAVPIYLNDGIADQVLTRFDPILNCKGES